MIEFIPRCLVKHVKILCDLAYIALVDDWLGEGKGLAPQGPVLLANLPVNAVCLAEVPNQAVELVTVFAAHRLG